MGKPLSQNPPEVKSILETARVKETQWEKKADAINKVAPILEQVRSMRGSRRRRRARVRGEEEVPE